MATQVPPLKNSAGGFICYISLTSQANPLIFQANPTLAAGDVKVSIDGGALANLNTLPDVDPDASKVVKVTLSQAEINGDNVQVIFSDAAGDEWCDLTLNIQTVARQIDDLAFPVVSGRGLDVTAAGNAGIDWANVENPTTALDLTQTTIKNVTDIATDIAGVISVIAALNNLSSADVEALLTATVADSVPADGTRPSIRSGILMLTRFLMERAVAGTTVTVSKEDGATANMTFTINNAITPTSITRAS